MVQSVLTFFLHTHSAALSISISSGEPSADSNFRHIFWKINKYTEVVNPSVLTEDPSIRHTQTRFSSGLTTSGNIESLTE